LNKYFSAYAAILGVLARLLFLSPQIAKLIGADTSPQRVELLQNGNFKDELLNSDIWLSKSLDKTNKLKSENQALLIENTAKENNYTILRQKIKLDFNRIYHLQVTYKSLDFIDKTKFQSGILKNGPSNFDSFGFDLEKHNGFVKTEKYFLL